MQIAFLDLGALNTVVALAIAVFKATLVVLFFMHVKYSTRLTWAVVLGSVFWLGILLALTMGDYLTRVVAHLRLIVMTWSVCRLALVGRPDLGRAG